MRSSVDMRAMRSPMLSGSAESIDRVSSVIEVGCVVCDVVADPIVLRVWLLFETVIDGLAERVSLEDEVV